MVQITDTQRQAAESLSTKDIVAMAQVIPEFRAAAEAIVFERTGGHVRITANGVIPIDRPGQTFRPLTAEERAAEARKTAEAERIEREG